jgi:hypothetical protein
MQTLQGKADELKGEQIRLKQIINEKNTASILVGIFANSGAGPVESDGDRASGLDKDEDPLIEELLRRPTSDIPDSTNVTELPSLILPGQHASKKIKACSGAGGEKDVSLDDGIDYGLLGKDRTKCSAEELDQIRRERNRMHAKRTRDRKRIFMEELSEICRKLEEENDLLRNHLLKIDPDYVHEADGPPEDASASSGASTPSYLNLAPLPSLLMPLAPKVSLSPVAAAASSKDSVLATKVDQIQTLLAVATSFERSSSQPKREFAAVSSDDSNDESTLGDPLLRLLAKRRRPSRQIAMARPVSTA